MHKLFIAILFLACAIHYGYAETTETPQLELEKDQGQKSFLRKDPITEIEKNEEPVVEK